MQGIKNPFHEAQPESLAGIAHTGRDFQKGTERKIFTNEEWFTIIRQNPCLLQRPIVEGRYKAVIAVPAERIEEVNKVKIKRLRMSELTS